MKDRNKINIFISSNNLDNKDQVKLNTLFTFDFNTKNAIQLHRRKLFKKHLPFMRCYYWQLHKHQSYSNLYENKACNCNQYAAKIKRNSVQDCFDASELKSPSQTILPCFISGSSLSTCINPVFLIYFIICNFILNFIEKSDLSFSSLLSCFKVHGLPEHIPFESEVG